MPLVGETRNAGFSMELFDQFLGQPVIRCNDERGIVVDVYYFGASWMQPTRIQPVSSLVIPDFSFRLPALSGAVVWEQGGVAGWCYSGFDGRRRKASPSVQ